MVKNMKKLNLVLLAVIYLLVFLYSCREDEHENRNTMTSIKEIIIDDANVESILSDINNEQKSIPTIKKSAFNLGGVLTPSSVYNSIPIASTPSMGTLPTVHVLAFPPIRHQGNEGSCAAWAAAYAARSIKQHVEKGGSYSESTNIFSPEYVYNQIKLGDCNSGTYLYKALELLRDQGVCRWTLMPYTDVSCSTMPNSSQINDASSFKINGYSRIPITFNDIKAHLAANHPIVVAGPVYENFSAGQALGPIKGGYVSYHAYCLIGYFKLGGQYWVIFQNSGGVNWGPLQTMRISLNRGEELIMKGCGLIHADYINTWIKEAYVMN